MKLGAHIYLWMERWSDREVALFDRVKGLGLDAVELSLGLDVIFSTSLTRRRAELAGVTLVTSPGGEWAERADLSSDDEAERRAALAFHGRMLEQSAELGAIAYAGAIYGRPGKVLRRRPPPDEFPRTADGLHALAGQAQRLGLRLVIEPMSRFRSHVVNTPAQASALVAKAGHPNLFILLDTYHLVTEVRDFGAAIRAAGDRLWGLHACENDRGIPGGGLLPWPEIFAALKASPAQYVGFETYNTALGDFGWRRGMFQDVCPDGDAFARAGVALARNYLGASTRAVD